MWILALILGLNSVEFSYLATFETLSHNVNKIVVFTFSSCGNHGRHGPTQFQCDYTYKDKPFKVEVVTNGTLKGTQIWTVPEDGLYRITAAGARGGKGVNAHSASKGGCLEGNFNLTEGEKIYIIVGQPGTDACSSQMHEMIKQYCLNGLPTDDREFLRKISWGGGGGGGATYVFKFDPNNNEFYPLIVAGGGGGQGIQSNNERTTAKIIDDLNITGTNGVTSPNGSGGGGGWNGTTSFAQSGRSLLEGAFGGYSCNTSGSVHVSGGYGGGGAACLSGGGGGGYRGGDTSIDNSYFSRGEDGTSYYHPSAGEHTYLPLSIVSAAFVEINMLLNCPCEYWCEILDWDKALFVCLCQKDRVLSSDGYRCEDLQLTQQPSIRMEDKLEIEYIILIGVAVTILVLGLATIPICYIKNLRRKNLNKRVNLELNTISSNGYRVHNSSSNRLRPSSVLPLTTMKAEYNPIYDFVLANCPEQRLNEINWDNLKIVRALGQGAFGEVYKGILAGQPDIGHEIPVAVKTLPALSTEQAEIDFFMEAIIMSKFDHPNIVKFIGVCFNRHPRYIILELLEGGDLKSFLREMRPKPICNKAITTPSLTFGDLIKISLDIANGCHHLEEKRFIHRDIAARNCLLTCKGPDRKCKIADFGMSKDIYRSDYYKKGGKAMLPIKWMPPEAFLDGMFSSKTDVWSFGILLWEIFSMGYMPYPGRTNHDVMEFVTSGGRLGPPEHCPPTIFQLMHICWAAIPETRPNFSEIIERLEESQCSDIINAQVPVFYQVPNIPFLSSNEGQAQSQTDDNSFDDTTGPNDSGKPLLSHQQHDEPNSD